MLKSTDGGRTWYSTGLRGAHLNRAYRLEMHPTDPSILLVTDQNGVFKTIDGGLSWYKTSPEFVYSFYDLAFKPNDPSTVYASTRHHMCIFLKDVGETSSLTNHGAPANNKRIELETTAMLPERCIF